ncbi:unnamed protein product [Thlaspi arvense]|uniref:Cation/H+ exchanger transmembrane domain-containing protein n=1 Tax=Thlaspi arvense TaxID=13288 RepID=A0AAU9SRI0_THLAR|nr:unnamed protein product [Thlaspi arvense]
MGVGLMEFLSIQLATEHPQVIPISVFIAILCLCLVIGHLLEENRWVNESITAIVVVSFLQVLGFCLNLHRQFQVKKKKFFHNFLTIMSFGVIGVFISTVIISFGTWWIFPKLGFKGLSARDYLAIGTIFSSTDTVCTLQILHQDETPLLYSLVFGEGVVNDATSVVLFNAVQKIHFESLNGWTALRVFGNFLYLFCTSTLLGIAVGLVTAFSLKTFYFGRHSTTRELAIMVLMAYLSYMLAELFSLSGILTVFFCGVLMSHYASYNVTESSRITSRHCLRQLFVFSLRHVFAMLSFIAETFIFLYVGTDALDLTKWKTSSLSVGGTLGVSTVITALVLLGRAAFVFPLSVLTNFMNRNTERSETITFKHQVIIWWAGLMRGAVSIALAFKQFTYSGVTLDPVNAAMVTNTTIVVLFTTLVFGFLTKPLVNYLLPPHDDANHNTGDKGKHSAPGSPKEDATLPLLSFDESASTNLNIAKDSISLLMEQPVYTIHRYWRKFDDTYMRPIFGGPRRENQPEC